MKSESVSLPSPFAIATDGGDDRYGLPRLVKRHGGCGLVVTEMVSAEGLVPRHRSHARVREYTEEEPPDFDSDLRRRSRQDGCPPRRVVEGWEPTSST